jgi:hypothetical protein
MEGRAAPLIDMPRIFIAGRSHVFAMKEAARNRPDHDGFSIARWGEDDPRGEHYTSTAELRATALSLRRDDVFAISYLGMNYAAFSLIKHPIEFDFFPVVGVDEGAAIIPRRMIDEALSKRSTKWRTFHSLARKTRAKVVFICTPPPKAENEFIRQRAARSLALDGESIASPALRLKLWRAEAELVRKLAEEYGAVFLDPPVETMTPDGFLRREYYEDATHANAAYGSLVLDQLQGMLPGRPKPPPPPPPPPERSGGGGTVPVEV